MSAPRTLFRSARSKGSLRASRCDSCPLSFQRDVKSLPCYKDLFYLHCSPSSVKVETRITKLPEFYQIIRMFGDNGKNCQTCARNSRKKNDWSTLNYGSQHWRPCNLPRYLCHQPSYQVFNTWRREMVVRGGGTFKNYPPNIGETFRKYFSPAASQIKNLMRLCIAALTSFFLY